MWQVLGSSPVLALQLAADWDGVHSVAEAERQASQRGDVSERGGPCPAMFPR